MTAPEKVRLNLGAGDSHLEGFTPIDRKLGSEVYTLAYKDESVDEIYASHVLTGSVKLISGHSVAFDKFLFFFLSLSHNYCDKNA